MNPVYWLGWSLSRLFAWLFFNFRCEGAEKIPAEGPVILAMNHESFLDPPLAGICTTRPLYYLARKTLMAVPILGPILPKLNVIPVNQDGGDMSALKAIIRILKNGEGTVIFPEGTRSPDGNLQDAQPGIGLVVAKTLAPVVPMRVHGSHEAFPKGGKPRFHRVRVVIGEPIYFTKEDLKGEAREVYQKISERVMAAIRDLPPPSC